MAALTLGQGIAIDINHGSRERRRQRRLDLLQRSNRLEINCPGPRLRPLSAKPDACGWRGGKGKRMHQIETAGVDQVTAVAPTRFLIIHDVGGNRIR